jgi:Sec23-binding domain of Sec16
MILSNTSEKVDLSRKAITTLGDTLYNRGDLFAAQFCYLVADISFGKWSNVNQETATISNSPTAVRLVLLGASQHKCFKEFATNEAIIMTEIYEYARTLNDEKFTIHDFQVRRFSLVFPFREFIDLILFAAIQIFISHPIAGLWTTIEVFVVRGTDRVEDPTGYVQF